MLFRSLAAISLLAATALADGASIIKSLQTVDKDIAALNKTLVAFDGNILLAIPILGASTTLNNDLDAGTKTAQQSANLTVDEAIALVPYVQQLAGDANITLTTAIQKAPLFKKDLLNGIVSLVLKDSQSKSKAYANAIIAKVPASLQPTAQTLVAPIDAGFAQAIAAYQ